MGVKFGLTLLEEHRLRVFDMRVVRRIFGPNREEGAGGWRRLFLMRSFINCTFDQIFLGDKFQKDDMGRACNMHKRREKCIQNFYRKT
jgi:hypothetical protein